MGGGSSEYKKTFDTIFREYFPILCVYASRKLSQNIRENASDVVIGVFTNVWEKKPDFETIEHFKAYLYRSTLNACLDLNKIHLRKENREKVFAEGVSEVAMEADFFQDILKFEVWKQIHIAIEKLPKQCTEVIKLSFIDGYNNEEIAQLLNLSIQTVKNTKSRGIQKLRIILDKKIFIIFLLFLS